jgi:hypothetical protein
MAVASYHMALRIEPQNASIWTNLGNVLRDLHRFEEAEQAQLTAIGIKPRDAQLHYHLGLLHMEQSKPVEALRHFEGAISLKPDLWQAQWDRSLALLQLGRWREAWPGYAHRWKLEGQLPPLFPEASWNGRPFRGTLVVHHEQGLGDTLLVSRYLPWAAKQSDKLLLICPPSLAPLLANPQWEIVTDRDAAPAPSETVRYCAAMDLLRHADAEPSQLSGKPYLQVPTAYAEKHRSLLPQKRTFHRVGIVWSGSPTFSYNHRRAVSVELLLRLVQVPQVKLFSLQKGEPAKQLLQPGMGVLVKDLADLLDDFADTAAVLRHLDLLVTTDTSVAHLAGALGVRTWLLLAHRADWRWIDHDDRTPWYDSVKIFRQKTPGDWDEVMKNVVADLKTAASAGL